MVYGKSSVAGDLRDKLCLAGRSPAWSRTAWLGQHPQGRIAELDLIADPAKLRHLASQS